MAKVPDDLLYKKSFSVRLVDYDGGVSVKEYDKPKIKTDGLICANAQNVQALICGAEKVEKTLISTDEIAELAGLTPNTIREIRNKKDMPPNFPAFPKSVKIKRTLFHDRQEIVDWIEKYSKYRKTIIRRKKKCDQN